MRKGKKNWNIAKIFGGHFRRSWVKFYLKRKRWAVVIVEAVFSFPCSRGKVWGPTYKMVTSRWSLRLSLLFFSFGLGFFLGERIPPPPPNVFYYLPSTLFSSYRKFDLQLKFVFIKIFQDLDRGHVRENGYKDDLRLDNELS